MQLNPNRPLQTQARQRSSELALAIQGVDIRVDAEGRYCLNDLHRAAGGEKRNGATYWLTNQQTKELIAELQTTGIPVVTVEGRNGGTYVVKELVYAYAMWISPSFHLKVISAFDELVTGQLAPAFNVPQSLPEALRLAADLADKNAALSAIVASQAPKVDALDRISTADGSLCIRDTAKALQVRPIDLTRWLQAHGWIYRRLGSSPWLGYQDKVQLGLLEHKVTTVSRSDGSDKVVEQVRVTSKGLARLSQAVHADLATMQ